MDREGEQDIQGAVFGSHLFSLNFSGPGMGGALLFCPFPESATENISSATPGLHEKGCEEVGGGIALKQNERLAFLVLFLMGLSPKISSLIDYLCFEYHGFINLHPYPPPKDITRCMVSLSTGYICN